MGAKSGRLPPKAGNLTSLGRWPGGIYLEKMDRHVGVTQGGVI